MYTHYSTEASILGKKYTSPNVLAYNLIDGKTFAKRNNDQKNQTDGYVSDNEYADLCDSTNYVHPVIQQDSMRHPMPKVLLIIERVFPNLHKDILIVILQYMQSGIKFNGEKGFDYHGFAEHGCIMYHQLKEGIHFDIRTYTPVICLYHHEYYWDFISKISVNKDIFHTMHRLLKIICYQHFIIKRRGEIKISINNIKWSVLVASYMSYRTRSIKFVDSIDNLELRNIFISSTLMNPCARIDYVDPTKEFDIINSTHQKFIIGAVEKLCKLKKPVKLNKLNIDWVTVLENTVNKIEELTVESLTEYAV
jgi:hypothetical protein